MANEQGLTLEQVQALTPEQIRGLTPEQVKALTPEQIKAGRAVLKAAGLGPLTVLGGGPPPEYIRADILARVRRGEITREQAEVEWKPVGWGRLAYEPPAAKHDPLKAATWTTTMTLAWIVTRDPEDVMWFDDKFRAEVLQWRNDGHGWELKQPEPMTMIIGELELAGDARVGPDYPSRKQKVADAIAELRLQLSNGSIPATAVAAGETVVPIPAEEWPRLVFCMDRQRDYLGFEHNLVPIYWRALLPTQKILKAWPPITKTRHTAGAEADRRKWLEQQVSASPTVQTITKAAFLDQAINQHSLAQRAAERVWTACVKQHPAWRKRGPKGPHKRGQ